MSLRDDWDRDGYVVLRQVVDPTTVAELHEACEHAFAHWRTESTAANQPGGHCYMPNAWIMLHLTHPQHYPGRQEFLNRILNAVALPVAIDAITEILREPPLFMQANYYFDPPEKRRKGGWHRDCEFFAYGDKEAEKRIRAEEADPPRELHMHIPMVPTAATGVVPGSHKRWDTPEEEAARSVQPCLEMPGGITLPMEPGDIGFFHVNSIHRGFYEVGIPRRTLAVTFAGRSKHRPFDAEWWKKTLGYSAAYQPWFLKPGYLDGVAPHTRVLFERFIDAYRDQWREENLYPQVIGDKRVEYFTKY